jgi:1-aminocyclopropane-1-carboxylate deaminase
MLPLLPSPIVAIENALFSEHNITLFIKRDDLIHADISGNKWRKLMCNVEVCKTKGYQSLLTFGGAFSNHIYATAAAGKIYGIKTIGIIRGEETYPLSTTLQFAQSQGMILHFVSREAYRDKAFLLENLKKQYGNFYYIPEGGASREGVKGCMDIVFETQQQLQIQPNYWCIPCGSGTTFTGIRQALTDNQKCIGFSALKIEDWEKDLKKLENMVRTLHQAESMTEGVFHKEKGEIKSDYHFGGYTKWKPELIHFINDFKEKYNIPLDPIYTGKMMYGIFDLIKKGYFERGSTIVAVHTGGLQGIEGFNNLKLKNKGLRINT